ncbi:DNA-processing protein DprA [Ideonella livida]|uniref:DNA-protecting protein DprA n=1 Tax=Ideonella livida TaxID=2707176 RepID=A0A7C9PG90_9BURK|nr:DNA-processing protein DprA [Ideonella livida]NDY91133.1 DNA-protecting protein DprA [Ideonella livida]
MTPATLLAWLRLLGAPSVGAATARRLVQALGSAEAALQAPEATLLELAGPAATRGLRATQEDLGTRLKRIQQWLDGAPTQRHVLGWDEATYPELLRQSPDAPPLLFAQGALPALATPCLAIVGSRRCTPAGKETAHRFAKALSEAGITIVSGLALGIDAAAHEGALAGQATGGAPTIAVVGTGLDRVYPARHKPLAHQIAADGLLLSELPPGAPPLAPHFPRRNRIIAGLSLGTLVVEADLQSGSLITARLALEANRDVMAIPGSIHNPQSRGCHQLIKQGALLVEDPAEVLDNLGWSGRAPDVARSTAPAMDAAPPAAQDLLQWVGHDPVDLDTLCLRSGRPAAELLVELLTLELEGHLCRHEDGRVVRAG